MGDGAAPTAHHHAIHLGFRIGFSGRVVGFSSWCRTYPKRGRRRAIVILGATLRPFEHEKLMKAQQACVHLSATSLRFARCDARRWFRIVAAGLTSFLLINALSFGRQTSRPVSADHAPANGSGSTSGTPAPVAPGGSGESAVRDISSIIGAIRSRHQVPGVVAAIVDHDHVAAIGAAGVREHDQPDRVMISDLFHIGSCTKSMTATMLGTLVEEGKLKWSTTVGEVFPDLAGIMDPGWKAVTVEQLVTHRSGAPADLSPDNLWGRLWNHKGTPTEQRMTLVEGVVRRPPVSTPGTKFLYSNAGFAIAGAMAEKITGQSWEDLMRARLFEPLGMTSAGFGAPGTPGSAQAIDQPRGHRVDGSAVAPGPGSDNPAAIGPAG